MKHTQYGLQPDDQYDSDDYPQPAIRVRTTFNELEPSEVTDLMVLRYNHVPMWMLSDGGVELDIDGGLLFDRIQHRRLGCFCFPYPDMDSCSLVGVKISRSTKDRLKIYDMDTDDLLAEYSAVE